MVFVGSDGSPSILGGNPLDQPRRRLNPRQDTHDLALAPTTTNLIDLGALIEDCPQLADVYAPLQRVEAFNALTVDYPSSQEEAKKPLSRDMLRLYDDLRKYDVVEALNPGKKLSIDLTCSLFLVPKRSTPGLGRLIIDARPVNRHQQRPGPMGLPSVAQVIDTVLAMEWAAKTDGVSYFYQFPLNEAVRPAFKARLAGWRGTIEEVQFKRMPMGWKFAPRVAQLTSNFVVQGLGVAWVDDFIVGGPSEEKFQSNRACFLSRLKRYNIKVDDEELKPSQVFTALGLDFDLKGKNFRISQKWIEEKRPAWEQTIKNMKNGSPQTIRALFEIIGALIWTDYVSNTPLWNRDLVLDGLSKVARAMTPNEYDAPASWPEEALHQLEEWVIEVTKNPWRAPQKKPHTLRSLIFSDASSSHGAWVRIMGEYITEGRQWRHQEVHHIFMHELQALCNAAQETQHTTEDLFCTDNTAVDGALRRGHSSVRSANKMLKETFSRTRPSHRWVPTHLQLADRFTRGEKIPPSLPVHLPAPDALTASSFAAAGLASSKRITAAD